MQETDVQQEVRLYQVWFVVFKKTLTGEANKKVVEWADGHYNGPRGT